jgi:hypothetical protein
MTMKRNFIIIGVVAAAVLLIGSAAMARRGGCGQGAGNCQGGGYGQGACISAASGSVNLEDLKKFQKETQATRDEIMLKRAELNNEYDKETPNSARMTELRKELIDLHAKVRKAAETYGLQSQGQWQGQGRGRGRGGMNANGGCDCGCGCGYSM